MSATTDLWPNMAVGTVEASANCGVEPCSWLMAYGRRDNTTVRLTRDDGVEMLGTINNSCNRIVWSAPLGLEPWQNLNHNIKKLHVVFMTHFDLGYTEASAEQLLDDFASVWCVPWPNARARERLPIRLPSPPTSPPPCAQVSGSGEHVQRTACARRGGALCVDESPVADHQPAAKRDRTCDKVAASDAGGCAAKRRYHVAREPHEHAKRGMSS